MKIKLLLFLSLISFLCFSQTKVGKVQFNDIDTFGKTELMLNGAGARDKDYAIALYLNFEVDGVEDGEMVADKNADMALTIKTTSVKDREELKQMIRIGLERATDGNSYLLENDIRDFLAILPDEGVDKYEIIKVLYTKDQEFTIFRNREEIGVMQNSLEFKKAFFRIWLGENPVSEELKEDLLGSTQINPILGKWKTFDKETGVALSIVQLYVINKKLYGTINMMLRQSERDAVCYKCQGDDKNQKVEGLVIIKNLKPKGEYKFVDGTFTDIENGEVSPCQIWIKEEEPETLFVKYKGGGGTHEWKRVEDDQPSNLEEYRTVKRF